ncbi:MAG: TaqI-like C-terminal specificity domain-containing protein [Nitrospirota bacterium]
MADLHSFKQDVQSLVRKFEQDKNHYLQKGYPEAQVRIDFLNPFFAALGWDIENNSHKPPDKRDVVIEILPTGEKRVTSNLRPDYSFRINGNTKFFVEAKAPSVALDDVNHILQAKDYAWNTQQVSFVILTDFEEFKLFDASLKPNPKYPKEGLLYDLKYADYLTNIEKLWELSKERVEQGSLEALLPRDPKSKRLRIPPDKSFLEDLTGWRTDLAKDINKLNHDLDVHVLNDVVQKLLDRIIFIRIAEDRKIRPERELWEIVAQWRAEGKRKSMMPALVDLFREVNDDLNGDIFKPHACESVEVDSELLADIINKLYFPDCRYRFDVIAVELLGSIYERYLGSTIRVTPQRVKVEEKPEIKKAGGVYYTPKFIVDYIVKNTVGKLVEGKTPKQIEKIKILDPACGSGSFLLGAYQYLIDYHLSYYRDHPKDATTLSLNIYMPFNAEEFALPLREKAKILRNNIFGVDIDAQAVEVTMMSLYLKALEGERGLLPRKQHLLPALGNNIKCGNSLIGYDIVDPSLSPLSKGGMQGGFFALDDAAKDKINPFDWTSKTAGFGEIIENGGFDAVIGNPPYVRQELLGDFKDYFQQHYEVYHGTADLYAYFIEKGVSLLRKDGLFSYIVANKWMRANYGEPLRKWMKKQRIEEITDFGDLQVFETATTYPCILRMRKGAAANKFSATQVKTLDFNDLAAYVSENSYTVNKTALSDEGWSLVNEQAQSLLTRLQGVGVLLGEYVKGQMYRGVLTGLNEAFIIDADTRKELIKKDRNSAELIKPFLFGRDIKRYEEPNIKSYLIFTRRGIDIKKYPAIEEHLLPFKKKLIPKPSDWKGGEWPGRKPGSYKWHEIQDSIDYYEEFDKPKIMLPDISVRGNFTLDQSNGLFSANTTYLIISDDRYLLGILNSALMTFFYRNSFAAYRGGYLRFFTQYLEKLPIRTIDFSSPSEKAIHEKLIFIVERMLDLHKKKAALPPSAEREKIEREIAVMDEKIDGIVYGLYGVTEAECRLVQKEC